MSRCFPPPCRVRSCLPMTPRCRCWNPVGAAPRPGGCGVMRWTTVPGPGQVTPLPPMFIPKIAKASAPPPIWRTSAARFRLMAMPGSNAWPGIAPMVPSPWRSAGLTCGGRSTSSTARRSRRSRPRCWRRSLISVPSRLKSVVNLPNTEDGCARSEVDPSSRPRMPGCKITSGGSQVYRIWARPSVTRCVTGRA